MAANTDTKVSRCWVVAPSSEVLRLIKKNMTWFCGFGRQYCVGGLQLPSVHGHWGQTGHPGSTHPLYWPLSPVQPVDQWDPGLSVPGRLNTQYQTCLLKQEHTSQQRICVCI